MYNISVSAVRHSGVVQVTVFGDLPNSCYEAKVGGTYPGTVFYLVDPGRCELFIEETRRPDSIVCMQALVPWTATVNIVDTHHDKVALLVNHKEEVIADILVEPTQFNVYGISGFAGNFGCRILPEGLEPGNGPFVGERFFGPATHEECTGWIARNCGKTA